MTEAELGELLTAAEAAEAIGGVTANAIRRAIREGRLPAVQVGPLYMVRRSDLATYAPVRKPRRTP